MPLDLVGAAYAATVAGGGIFGYVKAGSIPSLASGLLFGSVLMYGAYQASRNPPSYSVQLATTALLGTVMGYRFYNSGKIMPAGLILALSGAMLVRTGLKAAGVLAQSGEMKIP